MVQDRGQHVERRALGGILARERIEVRSLQAVGQGELEVYAQDARIKGGEIRRLKRIVGPQEQSAASVLPAGPVCAEDLRVELAVAKDAFLRHHAAEDMLIKPGLHGRLPIVVVHVDRKSTRLNSSH